MTIDVTRIRELLAQKTPGKWYTVDAPWGDGTAINAGSFDPHGGVLVADFDVCQEFGSDGEVVGHPQIDAELTCAAVNALPQLLGSSAGYITRELIDAVEAARRSR